MVAPWPRSRAGSAASHGDRSVPARTAEWTEPTLTQPTPPTDRLDLELARLTASGAHPTEPMVGVEHEYRVTSATAPVDFRTLIHDLELGGRRLDPGDANAYRCAWGGQITCDEAEAEVVTPPEPVSPGFAPALGHWAETGRRHLLSSLGPAHHLVGYSTHLNVSTPRSLGDRTCRLATRTFAPALMLLLDGPSSQGVAIRPRPGRAELCGEFADGDRLVAAALFWTGAVLACSTAAGAAAAGNSKVSSSLPPPLAANTVPDVERYGWVLYRHAFGLDLYARGRDAVLTRSTGGTISAQAHLELAWEAARPALEGSASDEELALVDQIVRGDLPLGIEGRFPTAARLSPRFGESVHRPLFGEVLSPPRRKHDVQAVVATWDHTVFRVRDAGSESRCVFACIPRRHLSGFLDGLADGRMDALMDSALDSSPLGGVLDEWSKTALPGFYGKMKSTELVAPERSPLAEPGDEPALMRVAARDPSTETAPRYSPADGTEVLHPTGASTRHAPRELFPDPDRPGKWRTNVDPTGTTLHWWAWVILMVFLSFGAGVLVGYLTGDSETSGQPPTVATAPTTTPTSPPTTTPPVVVSEPQLSNACVFTDHYPEAGDYPGVAIKTPSIIVVDLETRGVAPGTELNVVVLSPRYIQGIGVVGADGRVRVVLGISSYGSYKFEWVQLGDGTKLPLVGPLQAAYAVDDSEGSCP